MGSNVSRTRSPVIVHGASQSPLSYVQARSSEIFEIRPSTEAAFSVMPVPSVHLPPSWTPIATPSTIPAPAPQFHLVRYGHLPRPKSRHPQDVPSGASVYVFSFHRT